MRVVLGEDLTLLRDGLIRLLTAYDMDVVAAVDNGPELLTALVTHRPDVAVVDVRLPPSFTDEGLKAAIEARAQVPGLPVLVLSQHVEPFQQATRGGRPDAGLLVNAPPQYTRSLTDRSHPANPCVHDPPQRHKDPSDAERPANLATAFTARTAGRRAFS